MPDLEHCTEDEILDELHRRFGDLVYVRHGEWVRDASKEAFYFRWFGSLTSTIGALERAKGRLMKVVHDQDVEC